MLCKNVIFAVPRTSLLDHAATMMSRIVLIVMKKEGLITN